MVTASSRTTVSPLATLRPLRRADAAPMQRFLQGLSQESRRQRFHAVLNGCSAAMLAALTCVDDERQVAFVATVAGPDGGGDDRIVAEARYVVTGDGDSAEFALVVADEWQGRGLADALLDALFERAREGGLRSLFGEVMAGNARMLAFVQRRGFIVGDGGFDCGERALGTVRVERDVDDAPAFAGPPSTPVPSLAGVLRRWLHSHFMLPA